MVKKIEEKEQQPKGHEKPYEVRLADLNARIEQDIKDQVIKKSVDRPEDTNISDVRDAVRRTFLDLQSIKEIHQFDAEDPRSVDGSSIDIASFIAWKYVKDGLLDSAEIYYSARPDDGLQYVVVGKIEGKEVMIDLANDVLLKTAIPFENKSSSRGRSVRNIMAVLKNGEIVEVSCLVRERETADGTYIDVSIYENADDWREPLKAGRSVFFRKYSLKRLEELAESIAGAIREKVGENVLIFKAEEGVVLSLQGGRKKRTI